MQKSESTMFLKEMTENASLSNLLDMYELDELFEWELLSILAIDY